MLIDNFVALRILGSQMQSSRQRCASIHNIRWVYIVNIAYRFQHQYKLWLLLSRMPISQLVCAWYCMGRGPDSSGQFLTMECFGCAVLILLFDSTETLLSKLMLYAIHRGIITSLVPLSSVSSWFVVIMSPLVGRIVLCSSVISLQWVV